MCSTDVKVYSKREPTDCSHPVEIMLFVKKEEKKENVIHRIFIWIEINFHIF